MSHSKGFSFIEVVLVLALSSIIILIFIQNISFSRNFLNPNPQVLFYEGELRLINRRLSGTENYIIYDLVSSIGKRDCSLDNLENFKNITIPQFENISNGEVASLSTIGDTLIAGLNSATSSDPDLIIFNTKNWKIISSLNTGPGLAGMVLQGHYLFLANTSVNAQFQAVDISNLSAPVLLTSLKIPGSNTSNSKRNPTVTSISTSISIKGKTRIFIGTQKSDLGEIFSADFDGASFSFVKSYDTGSVVNDVFAEASGLWATSPSDDELFHYNASGTKDYVFNANGQSGNGKRIDIVGKDFKILGRTYGHEELVQIDGQSQKIGGSISDLIINIDSKGQVSILILANIGGVSVFQAWDLKLNKLLKSIALPAASNRIACGESVIYFGTSSSTAPFIVFTL